MEDSRPKRKAQGAGPDEEAHLPFSHSVTRNAAADCVEADDFRAGMRHMAGGVNVLTTCTGGERYGLTATSVCALSAEPPRLLACVNQRGTTFDALRRSRALAINVLTDDQAETAMRFAGMDGGGGDRFDGGGWEAGIGGLPILRAAACRFECDVAEIVDAASHAILICDVVAVSFGRAGAGALIYRHGAFFRLGGAGA
ncbi:flavin reductase family protein [Roseibacterium sp. SDUM158016]|uniref:flavin reductase family protein n=1 Tax=Roseicyclus sediminis TaxID=2980997 RepID=UPI0021CEC78F|nr:flavin reductase family protein [Roseibacterium sp. SDUM158016]MCU4652745.1 flavin reductase family protein [Roseibacterium sp. SDUM158016]